MTDRECVQFLQWCLPRLRMRWVGFRRVRRQVCKRVSRRFAELGLADANAYRAYLSSHDDEWGLLDGLCRVTISRFHRDRGVFAALREVMLPRLAEAAAERGAGCVRCWCAGCGSGEEPYTVQILWRTDMAAAGAVPLEIVATDADASLLERARTGRYPHSSVRDLPPGLRASGFVQKGEGFEIAEPYKKGVTFLQQDIRGRTPDGPFDLVFCRNLAFTYFDEALQLEVLDSIQRVLLPGGVLVVGVHETLPSGQKGFRRLEKIAGVYVRGRFGSNSSA